MLWIMNFEIIMANSHILHCLRRTRFSSQGAVLIVVSVTTRTVTFWIFWLEGYRSFISSQRKYHILSLFSVITISWAKSAPFWLNSDLKGIVQIFTVSQIILAKFTLKNKLRLKFRFHGSDCCHRCNLKVVIVS